MRSTQSRLQRWGLRLRLRLPRLTRQRRDRDALCFGKPPGPRLTLYALVRCGRYTGRMGFATRRVASASEGPRVGEFGLGGASDRIWLDAA